MQGIVDSFKGQPLYLVAIMAGFVLVFWWRGKVHKQLRQRRGKSIRIEKQVLNSEGPIIMKTATTSLNPSIYFNFSGHAWDAYEVLGLTADCTEGEIEAAYESSLSQVDTESQEFIKMAYEAIQEKR